MTLLKISGLSKSNSDQEPILTGIHFSIKKLQRFAIAGETGSGKTTLLKIIAGLAQADEGEVLLNHQHVDGADEKLVPGHKHIAYLSQHFELPKFLRVEQILSYNNLLTEKRANSIYKACEIIHLLARDSRELSGGEKQRIALARLLTGSPKVLLLDEPFSNLDQRHKSTLKTVIDKISMQLKITCLLVSHDPIDALSWADEIVVLKNGKLIQRGKPTTIYEQPLDAYVAGLFGKYNKVNSRLAKHLQLQVNDSCLLIRPENLSISNVMKKGIKGSVFSSKFYGSFYEISVDIPYSTLIVQSDQHFDIGATVWVSAK